MKISLFRFTFFLLTYLTLSLAATAQVIDIPDPNLRAAVENALGKGSGDTITVADMARLKHLDARETNIIDLTGLEHATNLTELNLGGNNISNISPLADLTNLRQLWLWNNNISDISPMVGLTNLVELVLPNNNISDISPLSGLTNLTGLWLAYNTISDISPLVANTGLGNGDQVLLNDNPLSYSSIKTHIPVLQSRGITVEFDDTTHLNQGEPRTVRMIYFLPNDRPYRAEVVQKMKDEIRTVPNFFAEQMAAHGYGHQTFRVETDAQGEPMVNRVDGQHPNSHYETEGIARAEIAQAFNLNANLYLLVIDTDVLRRNDTGQPIGGAGARHGKIGGYALVSGDFGWDVVTHELGHGFGLWHDFRDRAYIMGYDQGVRRLSACHADYLSMHPYFNSDVPIEVVSKPGIELLSPLSYPIGAKRVAIQLKVSDSEGLHQVLLIVTTREPHDAAGSLELRSCRSLSGKKEAIVDFVYDGVIPSNESTSLSNSLVHPIRIEAVDVDGDVNSREFDLFSEALQPLTKISGDNQQGLPNTTLPVPFVVELRDLNEGFAREGVTVTFTVTAGGGTLSQERTETDWNGRAETTLTLGPNFGENRVEGSAEGKTVIFTAVAGAAVEIPDPNLRAAIENALGKVQGQPIAPAEIATLTRLEARNANINDLTGLEHATHLKGMWLQDNNISDISPVAGLTNLVELILQGNAITDISPVSGLTYLTGVWLAYNTISDISPLVANTGLGSGDRVFLNDNPLSFVSINTDVPALQSRGVAVEFDADGTRPPDVNGDGSGDVLDLIVVTSYFGHTGENIATDVSGDGVVNVLDLVLIAGMFQDTAAAPSAQPQVPETLTAVEVQGWLTDARGLEVRDPIIKRGFLVLEQLLVSLTPRETELLANYPNPFNPETWIPYRLAEDAFVTLTIYDGNGRVVRPLNVGHRIASSYESRSKAVYWDGKNDLGEWVASGVYFYHLAAGDYSATRRMVILK